MLNNALIAKYEAGGNPATISSGAGDLGGKSYGIYQFSSNAGIVDSFVSWLCNYPNPDLRNYGKVLLSAYPINSPQFMNVWENLGTVDPGNFGKLQTEYAGDRYYNAAFYTLLNYYNYDLRKHSETMKAVVFSRAIQYGPGNMPELFTCACRKLGYDNLSYVDDKYFDKAMIKAIYGFLQEECINATVNSKGLYHSPRDWANGSYTVVKVGLLNRFKNEMYDALKMLEEEGGEYRE